jgi:hypothetical protein
VRFGRALACGSEPKCGLGHAITDP